MESIFGTKWCGNSQALTIEFNSIYKELNQDKKEFEVIWISKDITEQDYNSYLALMPWLAIPYEQKKIELIVNHFNFDTIPSIFVMTPKGDILTKKGRTDILNLEVNFLDKWKNLAKQKAAKDEQEQLDLQSKEDIG